MLSGVGIICFAGSYAVALALELSRLLFRSRARGALLLGWGVAGLVTHSAYLVHEALRVPGSPLSSHRDWCLVAAWILVVVYLLLTWFHPRIPFGLFLLPLVLGLVGVAALVADGRPNPRGPVSAVWGIVHGTSILIATASVLLGFVAGWMYLAQARQLRKKRPPRTRLRLPSLEWLDRANHHAIVLAAATLAIGVVTGLVLVARTPGRGVPWSDPVILITLAALAWLVAAVALAGSLGPARAGRRVAYLTVASFVVLVAVLAVVLSPGTQHGGRRASPPPAVEDESLSGEPTVNGRASPDAARPASAPGGGP